MTFHLKTSAEVKNVNPRVEIHGEDHRLAVDVKFEVQVPIEHLADIFKTTSADSYRYLWHDNRPIAENFKSIPIDAVLDDCKLLIDDREFTSCKIKGFKLLPREFNIAGLEFTLQYGRCSGEDVGFFADLLLLDMDQLEIDLQAVPNPQRDMLDEDAANDDQESLDLEGAA